VFFDDYSAARRSEGFGLHHAGKSFLGFGDGFGDDDPFAGGKAVGLDNDGRFLVLDVCPGFFVFGEAGTFSAGNAVFLHQFLGEDLARFNLGGFLTGAEDSHTAGDKPVGDAGRQGRFRADDCQVDLEVFGGFLQRVDITVFDIQVPGYPGGAGVAGSGVYFIDFRALGQLPDQGVFPGSATNY